VRVCVCVRVCVRVRVRVRVHVCACKRERQRQVKMTCKIGRYSVQFINVSVHVSRVSLHCVSTRSRTGTHFPFQPSFLCLALSTPPPFRPFSLARFLLLDPYLEFPLPATLRLSLAWSPSLPHSFLIPSFSLSLSPSYLSLSPPLPQPYPPSPPSSSSLFLYLCLFVSRVLYLPVYLSPSLSLSLSLLLSLRRSPVLTQEGWQQKEQGISWTCRTYECVMSHI